MLSPLSIVKVLAETLKTCTRSIRAPVAIDDRRKVLMFGAEMNICAKKAAALLPPRKA